MMQGYLVDDPTGSLRRDGAFLRHQSLYDAFEDGDLAEATILHQDEFRGRLTIGYQHTGILPKSIHH